ncbi:MAG: pyruvate, phosphate dikinase [Gammaproteobacteria bacterium]|nr:MAG: pyruvate, phosphate dikinase [Gammaproteobacteria bacterium]
MLYDFDHPHTGDRSEIARRLGSKGASLWVLCHELGLPVPPGFTLVPEAADAFREDILPAGLRGDVETALRRLEHRLSRRFGDPACPLTVSVRSGSVVSMPGMMDTVLNVGLTPATTEGLARLTGDRLFALNAYSRFLNMFCRIVLGLPSTLSAHRTRDTDELEHAIAALRNQAATVINIDDPWAQLLATVRAVYASWNSPRAVEYRRIEGIDDSHGTAVTIQSMVFGNLDARSGTGVVFSRDPATGENVLTGDYLPEAQGEDVVAGTHRTAPVQALAVHEPAAWDALRAAVREIERHYRDLCDIEFTVESGQLWVLQARVGKRSPAAAAKIAVDMVTDPDIQLSREEALARVPADYLSRAVRSSDAKDTEILARGIPASPGVATGQLAFTCDEAIELAERGEAVILVRRETSPEDVHGMGVAAGILTTLGGAMSHAAVVARGWGIPAVVGAETMELDSARGELRIDGQILGRNAILCIDGGKGLVLRQSSATRATQDPYRAVLLDWTKESHGTGATKEPVAN